MRRVVGGVVLCRSQPMVAVISR